MRVLLTGKQGQLGQAMCAALPANWQVLACDRHTLDITDSQQVQQCVQRWQPELIINTAAFTQVDAAQTAQDAAWQTNVEGPTHLARAARDCGATLLHFSTDYVFSGQEIEAFSETAMPQPCNYYGYSKWCGEQQVLAILPQAKVIRTAWLFSPFGRNFVRTMLHLALHHPVLRIVDDQRGCPTSAQQLVTALPALASPLLPAGVSHLAGSPAVSWFEFARAIFSCAVDCGWPAHRLPHLQPIASAAYSQAAPRPASSILCCERTLGALGSAAPLLDWRAALPETVSTLLRTDPQLRAAGFEHT